MSSTRQEGVESMPYHDDDMEESWETPLTAMWVGGDIRCFAKVATVDPTSLNINLEAAVNAWWLKFDDMDEDIA